MNINKTNVCDLGILEIAFLGDAVIEVYIREKLIKSGIVTTGNLTAHTHKLVCAPAMSGCVEKMLPFLTPDEENIYKRGRNAHTNAHPKNASAQEYHRATGFEALCGWLYLSNDTARLEELLKIAYDGI